MTRDCLVARRQKERSWALVITFLRFPIQIHFNSTTQVFTASFTALATVGLPAQLLKLGGENQSASVGSTLPIPLQVQMTDAGGNPVEAMTVSFTVLSFPAGSSGQHVTPSSAATDANGKAATRLSLGSLAGQYKVSASSPVLGGVFVIWTATATGITAVEGQPAIPGEFQLLPNYPNPFNPSTRILFALPERSDANVAIYDLRGVLVDEVVSETLPAGWHGVEWGADRFPSGVYIVRLRAHGLGSLREFSSARRLVLVK